MLRCCGAAVSAMPWLGCLDSAVLTQLILDGLPCMKSWARAFGCAKLTAGALARRPREPSFSQAGYSHRHRPVRSETSREARTPSKQRSTDGA